MSTEPNVNGEGQRSVEEVYQKWIGKPGFYKAGTEGAYGILEEINMRQGYMVIRPSIRDSHRGPILDKKEPTTIIMPEGIPVVRRPQTQEDLKALIKEGQEQRSVEQLYKEQIGQAGMYKLGTNAVYGVLEQIDTRTKHMIIRPSIVEIGGEIILEEERPTILTPEGVIKPQTRKSLEEIIERSNKENGKEE